jgi:hypothetical protein
LDSPTTRLCWNDKPEDDSDSDSWLTLKDGLDSMERKEWHLRYKRMNGLLVETASGPRNIGDTTGPENRLPSKQPEPNPPPVKAKLVSGDTTNPDKGTPSNQQMQIPSSIMVKPVSGDIGAPNDGARTTEQVASPPTHHSCQDNYHVLSGAFLNGSKSTSTSPAANGGLIAAKSDGNELCIGTREERALGRPALQPKAGCQVCKMAPGYSFLRGTRFDKNIGKGRKQVTESKSTKNPGLHYRRSRCREGNVTIARIRGSNATK